MIMLGGAIGNGNIAGVATAIAIGGPGGGFAGASVMMAMPNLIAIVGLGVCYKIIK